MKTQLTFVGWRSVHPRMCGNQAVIFPLCRFVAKFHDGRVTNDKNTIVF